MQTYEGVIRWFDRVPAVAALIDAKQDRRVSVVLPTRDDETTVAGVLASVRPLLGGLVDELLVVDAGSADRTVARARAAGALVYTREEALPEVPPRPGRGEVLWRSLAVATGDLVVFLGADLAQPNPDLVPALLAPLLTDPGIQLVKGCYRPGPVATGGERIDQLVARPLLSALAPALAEVTEPLGSEYAATRALLTSIPFAAGDGADLGVLVDCWQRYGPGAVAQADLGDPVPRASAPEDPGAASRQVIATLLDRLGIRDSGIGVTRLLPDRGAWRRERSDVSLLDRPPMAAFAGRHIA
ncbi:glucosyl-3-phosphoglycerate synthase [Nocardia thailandica]|uniref:Glucosyl-3-phosphoglycerate synthase n=1 Tax=Nocardia thailandica TaxID=257275 RepID=A0ABW6PL21_9NOCA